MTYEDLQGKDGSFENTPGTEQTLYFIPLSDLESTSEPIYFSEIDAIGEAVLTGVLGDNHVVKPFKRWFKMNILMNSGSIAGEMVGERGSRAVKTQLEGFYIGGNFEINGMQRAVKEDKYIVLAPHADGTVQQIGTMKQPALMNISTTTGKNDEGAKGATVSIEAIDRAAWVYEGLFNLEPRFDFIQGLYLDGSPDGKIANVFDATVDSTFGGWFTMETDGNDRHALLSSTSMELGVAINQIMDQGSEVLAAGDVYLYNNEQYYVFGNISALLTNSLHLAFTKNGSNIRFILNSNVQNELTVGALQDAAWTHVFGNDANSYYKGIADEVFFHDAVADSVVESIYNNRKGKVVSELIPSVYYYFTFNAGVNGDDEIVNDGSLGGVVNVSPATFVEWEPDEI